MVTYVLRPTELDGCWQSWSETDMPAVIRTSMESGHVKVRRRFTGLHRTASATVVMERKLYEIFMNWWRNDCRSGVLPTLVKEPTGAEGVWRFTSPPRITWAPGAKAFEAACELEQLPGWAP